MLKVFELGDRFQEPKNQFKKKYLSSITKVWKKIA